MMVFAGTRVRLPGLVRLVTLIARGPHRDNPCKPGQDDQDNNLAYMMRSIKEDAPRIQPEPGSWVLVIPRPTT